MTSPLQSVDVVVSGGGLAGMVAAAAMARLGLRVVCADPAVPVTDRDAEGADLRSTALLKPSRDFLDRLGLWAPLAEQASPLRVMRIVDAGGPEPEPRLTRDFVAADIGAEAFGWNLPNWALRRAFAQMLEGIDGLQMRFGTGVARVLTRSREARVTLTDGTRLSCRLLIGADGRNSAVRTAAGIGVHTTRYGQKALAFAVTHPIPHDGVSTEIHRSGGPFTLVPLPDRDGRPSSAVVWMEHAAEALRLAALPEAEFNAAATRRSCSLFGPLTLVSRRPVWPIITQKADRLTAERTALVAEAAHVVPPIGAQGLNMSLADIRTLTDLAEQDLSALGTPPMLARYARARWPDVTARVAGIDALNRASMVDAQVLRDARMRGLAALHALTPVRRTLMRTGLGAAS
jgi:2-octaprenyl-6-methoxyphenol hydroxylase